MSTLRQKTTGIVTATILLVVVAISSPINADDKLPESGKNNTWYTQNDADTVFVFVHGVLSDSRQAWAQENDPSINWPRLIDQDEIFESPSIFLGGFYTATDSGAYDMRDAANELYRNLVINGVLKKPKIIFIAHSTGGIVVRHMLVRKTEKFADKRVGLVLIASPSLGSRDADRLSIITRLTRHQLGQELKWDAPFLRELDKDFRNLVNNRKLPALIGTEWLEHHYVGGELGKLFGLARDEVVVEEDSAARYFGEPIVLADTTHITAVKPASVDHPAHASLRFFYLEEFQALSDQRLAKPSRPMNAINSNAESGTPNKASIAANGDISTGGDNADLLITALNAVKGGECPSSMFYPLLQSECMNHLKLMRQIFDKNGSVKGVNFVGMQDSSFGLVEVYQVNFENGAMTWSISTGPDGRLATFWSPG